MAHRPIKAGDTGILVKYNDFTGAAFKEIIANQEVKAMRDSPASDDLVKVHFTDPGVIQRLRDIGSANNSGWNWFKSRIRWDGER